MSFDLAVWFESERVSVARATETYERLCDGDLAGRESSRVRPCPRSIGS